MDNTLNKYIRIYKALFSFSLSKSLEFRFDFFFRFIMDCAYYAVQIGFFEIIFLHTENLAGWSRGEVIFFISSVLIVDSIFMIFFANNVWQIPELINKGILDYYLIKPISSIFLVLLKDIAIASILNFFVALGILFYAITLLEINPDIYSYLGFLFLMFNSMLLYLALRLLTVLPVFWTHSKFGFHMLFRSLEEVSNKPDIIYKGTFRLVFTTVIPVLVMASFPAKFFFNKLGMLGLLYSTFITFVFVYFVYWLWKKGLQSYSSASS